MFYYHVFIKTPVQNLPTIDQSFDEKEENYLLGCRSEKKSNTLKIWEDDIKRINWELEKIIR